MNIWHGFSNLYLVSSLSFLGLVCLNSVVLAADKVSEPTVAKTDTEWSSEKSIETSSLTFSPPLTIPTLSNQTSLEDIPQEPTPTLEGQVTSVSQLKNVQPTDWAFQALQSLIERYGVITGYPDGTFRGNRTITRYEFAVAERFPAIASMYLGLILNLDLCLNWHFLGAMATDITRKRSLAILILNTGWLVLRFQIYLGKGLWQVLPQVSPSLRVQSVTRLKLILKHFTIFQLLKTLESLL